MEHEKILPFASCDEHFRRLREAGRRIVHCHGTFDLLHPGHVKHLAEAKALGDVLVVSVTSAPYVNKGPGRPAFSDAQRAFQLAHLAVVDHVVVVPHPYAVEIIERVRPHVYCKGTEYASPGSDTERRIDEDAGAVARVGGEVRFVGEPLHSSTRLISQHLDTLDPEVRDYLSTFPGEDALERVARAVGKMRELRVLVVGDLIIDRYTYCHVQGLTSKSKVLSVRPTHTENQLGGSLAVARHVSSFVGSTHWLALAGTEPWLDDELSAAAGSVELDLVRDPGYQTIVKERFVERPGRREELIKYFALNQLVDAPPARLREALLERLEASLGACDLVLLCDYGHGMVDDVVQRLLEDKSPYLALNAQTNSYNHGFNLITKYRRCDLFALDETELCLAFGRRGAANADLLGELAVQLDAAWGWLTLGSSGSIGWSRAGQPHACPALTRSTIDTVGAGDAFLAVAALCGRVEADAATTSVLANLAGALAAQVVGNREALRRDAIVKNAEYLLKAGSALGALPDRRA
jgi:rfaE bifunctional protein nucleotidyltransferase chain/domain